MSPAKVKKWTRRFTSEGYFFRKVRKAKNGCWLWKGCLNPAGYGVFGEYPKKVILAHRYSWKIHNTEELQKYKPVCHRCDNRACINPEHLYLGTPAENSRDMVNRGRSKTGRLHWNCRLSESDVRTIKGLFGTKSNTEIGRQFKVTHSNISAIKRGRSWKHIKINTP